MYKVVLNIPGVGLTHENPSLRIYFQQIKPKLNKHILNFHKEGQGMKKNI